MFSIVFRAENFFIISCTFLHSCDKTTRIDQVFTHLSVTILLNFFVSFFVNTLSYIFCFYVLMQICHLIKYSSSTGVVNIACDFVICYSGESVCQKPVRPKTNEILKINPLIIETVYLGLLNII